MTSEVFVKRLVSKLGKRGWKSTQPVPGLAITILSKEKVEVIVTEHSMLSVRVVGNPWTCTNKVEELVAGKALAVPPREPATEELTKAVKTLLNN